MRILGIETSCDETAAAVVADGYDVQSSVVAGQDLLHAPYRGVVPEIAARAHLQNVLPVVHEALGRAGAALDELDALAVVNVPGLVGALLIGVNVAKAIAWVHRKPLIAVNHLHAHIYAAALAARGPVFPCVSLVVSGGHTSLYHSRDELTHDLLGATTDDAAGEAFDKVAAVLGLGYPGGPEIERVAREGDPKAVPFPRPRLEPGSLDFSFSGLKTAVLYHCRGQDGIGAPRALSRTETADVAASFQEAVVDVLVEKTMAAAERVGVRRVAVGGGVARNGRLRARLAEEAARRGLDLMLPAPAHCLDNAAMVAGLAWHLFRNGRTAGLDLDAFPRTRESRAPYRREAGP